MKDSKLAFPIPVRALMHIFSRFVTSTARFTELRWVAVLLDVVRESLTIMRVKTKIFSLSIVIIINFVWASAYAGSVPSQAANPSNVVGLPVSASQPSPAPPPAKSYQVCYGLVGASCNGFIALVTIQNKGTAPINGWTLRWNYTGNQVVTFSWDGNVVQSGKTVSVVNASCNKTIPAGGTVCFGLQACYSGANINPTVFSLQ